MARAVSAVWLSIAIMALGLIATGPLSSSDPALAIFCALVFACALYFFAASGRRSVAFAFLNVSANGAMILARSDQHDVLSAVFLVTALCSALLSLLIAIGARRAIKS